MFEGGPDRLWKEGEKRLSKELDMELLKEGFEDCAVVYDEASV